MIKQLLILWVVIGACVGDVWGQIHFPNHHDAAQHWEAKYGYISGFVVEVDTTGMRSLTSDNGIISMDTIHEPYFNIPEYFCIPKRLGNCTITLVKKENGVLKTYSKSIKIIEVPLLTIELTKVALDDSNKLYYILKDLRTNKNVINDYYKGEYIIILIDSNNLEAGMMYGNFDGEVNITEFKEYHPTLGKIKKVIFEVTLFGKESDKFAARIEKEFVLE